MDRFLRHLHAVGPHIGDQAGRLTVDIDTLIQTLREPHRLLRAEAQLARGLLLQGRCGERWRRIALDPAPLHRTDRERARFDGRLGRKRQGFVIEVKLIEPLAVQMRQPSGERGAARGEEQGLNRPIFACPENLDLRLTVADQAQRDGLDAPGAAAAGQLPPQHRRQREPHQIVQRSAGHVGLDQRLIQFAGMGNGVADGVAGDFVEGDAMDGHALQCVLVLQHRPHMPGNRFAFAIRVSGEIQGLGACQRFGDGANLLVAPRIGLPVHREVVVGPDAAIFWRQVTDMSETGENRVTATQVAVDGLGLGGGFDDNNI